MDYDLIVRNGFVVDGTGLPRRRVDVGVLDGRVAKFGRLEGARAKDMDPVALSGVGWSDGETFGGFMDSRTGKLGVNFACYMGRSNLRRWAMGEAAVERAATADEGSRHHRRWRRDRAGRRAHRPPAGRRGAPSLSSNVPSSHDIRLEDHQCLRRS